MDTLITPNRSSRPGRMLELDALRAMAAISLVLFHLTYVYPERFGFSTELPLKWHFGAYGTELFFILSGFVNSMSLLRRGRPGDFLMARVIRIVPMFLIMVIANIWIVQRAPLSLVSEINPLQLLANLTLMPKIFGFEAIDPVLWTLQVEMLFYGVLVALFYLCGRMKHDALGWGGLMIASLVVCPLLDGWQAEFSGAAWFTAVSVMRQILVLDFAPLFAIGFFLYKIYADEGKRWLNVGMLLSAAAVFHSIDHGKHNPLGTAVLVVLIGSAAYGKLPFLRAKPFMLISSISYAMYLGHNNLGCVLMYTFDQAGWPPLICLFVAIAFGVSFAILVTRRVEQPITRWLRRAYENRRRDAAMGTVAGTTS